MPVSGSIWLLCNSVFRGPNYKRLKRVEEGNFFASESGRRVRSKKSGFQASEIADSLFVDSGTPIFNQTAPAFSDL
jgi:hypothetical protein